MRVGDVQNGKVESIIEDEVAFMVSNLLRAPKAPYNSRKLLP